MKKLLFAAIAACALSTAVADEAAYPFTGNLPLWWQSEGRLSARSSNGEFVGSCQKLFDGVYDKDGNERCLLNPDVDGLHATLYFAPIASFKPGATICLTKYAMHGTRSNHANRFPAEWTLSGSPSGEEGTWTVIDSQTGRTYDNDKDCEFAIAGGLPTNLRFFKFEFTAPDKTDYIAFNEIELWGSMEGGTAASFENAEIEIEGAADGYLPTGAEITPTVTVKLMGDALKPGVDYSVSYADNVEPGTATVTVTGQGEYTGSKTATFAILSDITAEVRKSTFFTCSSWQGAGKAPVTYYGGNDLTLVDGKKGGNDTRWMMNVATVNAFPLVFNYGIGSNFSMGGTIVVAQYVLTSSSVQAGTRSPKEWTLFGSATGEEDDWHELSHQTGQRCDVGVTPVVYVIPSENRGDYRYYRLSFAANNGDTYMSLMELQLFGTVTGGTKPSVADAEITGLLDHIELPANGVAEQNLTVIFGGVPLVKDVNYELTYRDADKPGYAWVTVSGVSNFTGSKTFKYIVMPQMTDLTALAREADAARYRHNSPTSFGSNYGTEYLFDGLVTSDNGKRFMVGEENILPFKPFDIDYGFMHPFGRAKRIWVYRYVLTSACTAPSVRFPKKVVLQGSNTGMDGPWTPIVTNDNLAVSVGLQPVTNEVPAAVRAPYRYYRLSVLEPNEKNTDALTSLQEMQLLGALDDCRNGLILIVR